MLDLLLRSFIYKSNNVFWFFLLKVIEKTILMLWGTFKANYKDNKQNQLHSLRKLYIHCTMGVGRGIKEKICDRLLAPSCLVYHEL